MPIATQTATASSQNPASEAGVLKLRGSHSIPETTAFAELDKNGVSRFGSGMVLDGSDISTVSFLALSRRRRRSHMSTEPTNGWKASARGSRRTTDRHGSLRTCPILTGMSDSYARGAVLITVEDFTTVTVPDTSNSSGISERSLL